MRHLLYTAAGLAALALVPTGAKAQDADWGCQILLCAASQSPSWQGVPYCVPPMKKLISAMAKPGFDWPVCHQAKAGEPGREEYEECPKGTKVGYSRNRDGFRGEPDQCVKTVDACQERRDQSYRRSGDSSDNRCVSPRARRENPWFFDIPNDKGVKERFWLTSTPDNASIPHEPVCSTYHRSKLWSGGRRWRHMVGGVNVIQRGRSRV